MLNVAPQSGKSHLAEERREIKDAKRHMRKDELTLFTLGFLVKRCHYVLHTGPLKDLCMCGMRPPGISMQMNTMCTELSLLPSISPLSRCAVHRGATVLVFKETQMSQTVAVLQPASARRCGDLLWLLPRRGFTSAWLIPEQDAEGKSQLNPPPPKKAAPLASNRRRFHQRAMEMSSEENVYFEISARCSLCCCFSLSIRDL